MKLTSRQFTLVIAALCVVAGGSYQLGKNSNPPTVLVKEITIGTPATPAPISLPKPELQPEKPQPGKLLGSWYSGPGRLSPLSMSGIYYHKGSYCRYGERTVPLAPITRIRHTLLPCPVCVR